MSKCSTPGCYRQPVVLIRHSAGVYGFTESDTEAEMCVSCAVAYREGHNRPRNEFTYNILDGATKKDVDKIKERLMNLP